jgi:hypothetical protein
MVPQSELIVAETQLKSSRAVQEYVSNALSKIIGDMEVSAVFDDTDSEQHRRDVNLVRLKDLVSVLKGAMTVEEYEASLATDVDLSNNTRKSRNGSISQLVSALNSGETVTRSRTSTSIAKNADSDDDPVLSSPRSKNSTPEKSTRNST